MSTDSNEAPQVPSPPPYAGDEPRGDVYAPPQPLQAPSVASNDGYGNSYGSPYAPPQVAPQPFPQEYPSSPGVTYGQSPAPVFYPGGGNPHYGQYQYKTPAQQLASNSMTMGLIGFCLTLLIGWVPIFGLVGVAGGLGLGIPAILQSSKASRLGEEAVAGKILGWLAVAFSVLWVVFYMSLFMIGAVSSESMDTVSA